MWSWASNPCPLGPACHSPPPTSHHRNAPFPYHVSSVGVATGKAAGGGVRQRASAHFRDERAQGAEGVYTFFHFSVIWTYSASLRIIITHQVDYSYPTQRIGLGLPACLNKKPPTISQLSASFHIRITPQDRTLVYTPTEEYSEFFFPPVNKIADNLDYPFKTLMFWGYSTWN